MTVPPAQPHPFAGAAVTLARYHSLLRNGAIRESDRVELVCGKLVAMTPQGLAHAFAVQELNAFFVRAAGEDHRVRPQLPLTLECSDSEPEPDLAVVAKADAVGPAHPRSARLVIEVAGDSLEHDRGTKASVYARAAVLEYWIVDLAARRIEVRREPDPASGTYGTVFTVEEGETIAALAWPDAGLPVRSLFV